MKLKLFFFLIWFPLVAQAELFEGWTSSEKKLFAAGTAAVALDYATTYNLLYVQHNFVEINPILGPHPSKTDLALFSLSRVAINYVIADHLNHNNRRTWLITFTAIGIIGPAHNFGVGARLTF